jgi:probable HAF family extracellular repeat protein
VIWYAAGGSKDLGTLGGEYSSARDINATREVVGISTASNGVNTAFFWSESLGMLQLPLGKGLRWAAANSLSDVRPDGTRLIVGTDSRGNAVAWVVRNP